MLFNVYTYIFNCMEYSSSRIDVWKEGYFTYTINILGALDSHGLSEKSSIMLLNI